LIEAIDSSTRTLSVNIVDDGPDSVVAALRRAAARGVAVRARVPGKLAKELEDTTVDLSLLPRPGTLCVVDRQLSFARGRGDLGVAVRGGALAVLLETTVLGLTPERAGTPHRLPQSPRALSAARRALP
jgi:hypothetical protein